MNHPFKTLFFLCALLTLAFVARAQDTPTPPTTRPAQSPLQFRLVADHPTTAPTVKLPSAHPPPANLPVFT